MGIIEQIQPRISPLTPLPARRRDLIVRPSEDDGAHVVKDPRTGEYFRLGPEESFLLLRLDGASSIEAACAAFERHFRQPLAPEELEEFIGMARGAGWLQAGAHAAELTDATEIGVALTTAVDSHKSPA